MKTPFLLDPRLAAFAQSFLAVGMAQLLSAGVNLELLAGSTFTARTAAVYGGILAVGCAGALLHLCRNGVLVRLGRLARASCRSDVDLDDLLDALRRLEIEGDGRSWPISAAAGCAGATLAMLIYWMCALSLRVSSLL